MADNQNSHELPESWSSSEMVSKQPEQEVVIEQPPPHREEPLLEKNETVREEQGDGTLASQQILHGPALVLCSLALLCSMFLYALDQTIVGVILSTVGSQFGSFGNISWIASGLLLPACVMAMSWGNISLIFGRKYTMLVAIVVFEAGSLVCALSKNMNMLIGGRVLAGVGGGGIQILVFMIMSEIVSIEKRGIVQGLVGAAYGIASVVAPLVGGAFTSHVSWRWCFYINLPIGGVAFVLIFYLFRPPKPKGTLKEKLARIDYFGMLLLALGFILVLLALTFGSSSSKPWNSPLIIAFFTVGGVIFLIFLAYNFTLSKHPLFPAALVTLRPVNTVGLCMFCVFNSFVAAFLYLATYFQVVREADALHSGIDLLPLIIPVVTCSIITGILVTKTRYVKPYVLFGTATGSIGMGLLTLLDETSTSSQRIGYLILPGIGIGCTLQCLTINIQLSAPKQNGGVLIATAYVGFFRALGSIFGSTLGQTVLFVIFKQNLQAAGLPSGVDYAYYINSPQTIQQLPPNQKQAVIKAFVKGFRGTMYLSLGSMLAGFVLSLFITNARIPKIDKTAIKENDIEVKLRSAQKAANN
jgi:MFS family permease